MTAQTQPRTGRELLASDMVVAKQTDDAALAERLSGLPPWVVESLDGQTSVFSLWQRQKQRETELAEAQARLKTVQAELAEENNAKLKLLLDRLHDLQRDGLVRIEYRQRVKCGQVKAVARDFGVREGDVIFVHSKLSGLGYLEAGIEGVIAELRDAVGAGGTLAMPAFSQNYPGMIEAPYDKETSESTAGRITEVFRKLPGVQRSDNPCHSIAAVGPQAEDLTASTGNYEMFDRNGPFGKLYDLNARIIMLGCSIASNTTLHAVEAWALPYLPPIFLYASDGKGGIREVLCKQFPNWCREWYGKAEEGLIQKRLFARGAIAKRELGRGAVYAMETRRLVDTCLDILREEPDILLCKNTKCRTCPACRAMLVDWRIPNKV